MYYFVSTIMPYIMSAIAIYMNVLAGSKRKHAWAVGLGNQMLWLIWIVITGNWGFIFMNLALWIVYLRNHVKWQEEVIDSAYYEEDELPTVEVAVDPQTPLAIAWEKHRKTVRHGSYAKLVESEKHRTGALWGVFLCGWQAGIRSTKERSLWRRIKEVFNP